MLASIFVAYPQLRPIIQQLQQQGARVLVVGGAVRDQLLGLPVTDLDLEVYGLTLAQLQAVLERFGSVLLVGQAFGVLRLAHLPVDWAVPRLDQAGRKPLVQTVPELDLAAAFRRRDLTINAMGIDCQTGVLVDIYGGTADLQRKILRAVDLETFGADPLRFFRVMSLIGRFEFTPDTQLNQLCMVMDLSQIARERIEQEFQKLWLKSQRPALGMRWLQQIGRLQQIMPELAATIGVPQNPDWHPEGDVFEHTMQALDAVSFQFVPQLGLPALFNWLELDQLSPEHLKNLRILLCWAAVCHDLGKAKTTALIAGKYRSFGHEIAGVPLSKQLLRRITSHTQLLQVVPKLVLYHMRPGQYTAQPVRDRVYKQLALQLAPVANLTWLTQLALADRAGRNGDGSRQPLCQLDAAMQAFLQRARSLGVAQQPAVALLTAADFLDVVPPGPQLGKLLAAAYQLQIQQGINDRAVLRAKVLAKLRKN